MPPTANPPSKKLFLTLLKQARAYGVGLVLSTQNPVDLDYKGLSNTGTWFIGRLQTERDKARVLDGLEGAAAGGGVFNKKAMEQTLAGLGKRVFLLHNVHESEPVIFHTRWAMSYLPGPLTRDQIKTLMAGKAVTLPEVAIQAPVAAKTATVTVAKKPALPPGISQYYLPASATGEGAITYYPQVFGAADVLYSNKTYKVDTQRQFLLGAEIDDGPIAFDWDRAEALNIALTGLDKKGLPDAGFAEVAAPGRNAKNYPAWERDFKKWLRNEQALKLFESKTYKCVSEAGESEADFRIRLQQQAKEQRDLEVGKLRVSYDKKAGGLHHKLRKAEREIEEQRSQASQKKMESAISIGGALLGAFLGRKKFSSSTFNKIGTAARHTGYAAKEARDVRELEASVNTQTEPLEEVSVRPKTTDINVLLVALLWLPFRQSSDGRTFAAF